MTNIAPELPPPGLEHVPEGGAVGPVQSGWRLAAREFAGTSSPSSGSAR